MAGRDRRLELVATRAPQRGGPLEEGVRGGDRQASQRDRSCCSRTTSRPSSKRAARRACCRVSRARRPRASGSSGRDVASRPASHRASSARSRSSADCPEDETNASLNIRYVTVSTSSRRSARCAGAGIVSGMPASTILRLARTIRCAIVCSLTRKARAICAVVIPTTARRVSASRDSTASAGWQQPNSSGRRSSTRRVVRGWCIPSRSRASARSCRWRLRTVSIALRRAATWSHAPGRSATPPRPPRAQRLEHSVLHRLLGDVEVADEPVQRRDDRARLGTDGGREGRVRAGLARA